LCRSYDYVTNAQKLKLFPATLKGNALRWFMSLGGHVITTWDQMKEKFLAKYQDYCRTREKGRNYLRWFRRRMKIWRTLWKDYSIICRDPDHPNVSKDILKTILLKGVRDDCLDMLNMLGKGDISKESYDEIVNLCKRCSRGAANRSKSRDNTLFKSPKISQWRSNKS
jgi:hypothetical protein